MTPQMSENNWLTIAAACDALKVSERTLWRRIEQGKYETRMEHGRRFVRLTETAEDSDNRDAIYATDDNALVEQLKSEVTHLRDVIDRLTAELSESNRRNEETQRETFDASKRSDMLIAQMTQQMERAQLQLEDLRKRRSWWQRLTGK